MPSRKLQIKRSAHCLRPGQNAFGTACLKPIGRQRQQSLRDDGMRPGTQCLRKRMSGGDASVIKGIITNRGQQADAIDQTMTSIQRMPDPPLPQRSLRLPCQRRKHAPPSGRRDSSRFAGQLGEFQRRRGLIGGKRLGHDCLLPRFA